MYYLDQLTLKNVRSYKDRPSTIMFSPNLTIITGHNGAGKSTLLEALLYLLSQDRPVYDRLEPKDAPDNASMLMQCILRHGSCVSETKPESPEDPSLQPSLKASAKQRNSAKGKSSKEAPAKALKDNQILLELTRTIKRAGKSKTSAARRNRTPDSPELASTLQLCDGLLQYCLICGVNRSNWMFETPEEISKSTDQILNVDRFTKLSKDFSPSTREVASSETSHTMALKTVAEREEALHNWSDELVREEQDRDMLKKGHDFLATFDTSIARLTAAFTKVSELLKSCTTVQQHPGTTKGRKTSYIPLDNVPVSAFLREKEGAEEDSIPSYLIMRSGDAALLEIYKSTLETSEVPSLHIQVEDARTIFSNRASDSVRQANMLLASWEKLKAEYDPKSIPKFVDRHRAVLTLLSSTRDATKDRKPIVPSSGNEQIKTKCTLVASFYQIVTAFPGDFELNENPGNIDALATLCQNLSVICSKVSTIDEVISSNIAQTRRDLESIRESITDLDKAIKAEQRNRETISTLVSLSTSISGKSIELQGIEYEEISKQNTLQSLSSRCVHLKTSVSQQQKIHERLLHLHTNYYVPSEALAGIKDTLTNSSLLTYLPVLLSATVNQDTRRGSDIGEACKLVLRIWEESWGKLGHSLEAMGYPRMNTLTGITSRISPECLALLIDILSFINDKIHNCTNIDLSSLFTDSDDLLESLTKMAKGVSKALQAWLTTTGNMITVVPTLRSDFSIYIRKRTELSATMVRDVLTLFDDFLEGYKHDVAQQKEDLVNTILSALDAFINILPIALDCQHLNISFDKVRTEVIKLESIEQTLQKIVLNECEISSSGDQADIILYQILYDVPINIVTCTSFPLLAPQLSHQFVDCCSIKDAVNTFCDKLVHAATHLESTYSGSKQELDNLIKQLNDEENNLTAAKQESEEAERRANSMRSSILELKQQFLATSIDGKPYSIDYAQELTKKDIQISEKLKHCSEERCEMMTKADALQKELDLLALDARQISLPKSTELPLMDAEFLNMKEALEKIRKSPSAAEVDAAANSYRAAHDETLRLQAISTMLNEYAVVGDLLSILSSFAGDVCLQSTDFTDNVCCRELLTMIKRVEEEKSTSERQTLHCVLDSLENMLSLYKTTKQETAIRLYKKEGMVDEKKTLHEKLKSELQVAIERYAQSRASLLIVKGAATISLTMQRTVKEFKHMLLKRLNNKLQSLWNQCYARSGTSQNEISTVRLAINQVGVGDKARDIVELQAICTNTSTGCPVARSFRETCSSGQQVILSILLRLAFSYISMSPFSFIVLDEPTNYLDKENNKNLAHVLADFISNEQNIQVVIITHSLEFCDALIAAANNTNTRTYRVSMETGGSEIREIVWGLDDNLTY